MRVSWRDEKNKVEERREERVHVEERRGERSEGGGAGQGWR